MQHSNPLAFQINNKNCEDFKAFFLKKKHREQRLTARENAGFAETAAVPVNKVVPAKLIQRLQGEM